MWVFNNAGQLSSVFDDELDTLDITRRVSEELKRCNISQALFAQAVLGRSQGTLSDLLRKPKPWAQLKSGRETFAKMRQWLMEPEKQRLAYLNTYAVPGAVVQYMAITSCYVIEPEYLCITFFKEICLYYDVVVF